MWIRPITLANNKKMYNLTSKDRGNLGSSTYTDSILKIWKTSKKVRIKNFLFL